MPRFTPIRIRSSDKQEYQRLVKNTKAKIRRTSKNYGVDLSSEVNIPKLEDFKTRKQFNEFKQSQESFTNRSNLHYQFKQNDYGVVATKAELQKAERNTKQAQRIAESFVKDAENKPFISGGKVEGTQGQQMKQMGKPNAGGVYVPKDFDFDVVKTRKDLQKIYDRMERKANPEHYDEKMIAMQENYIQKLQEHFNSDADELVKILNEMEPSEFFAMYNMFNEFDFKRFYPMKGVVQSTDDDVSKLIDYTKRYQNGDVDKDFNGF